MTSAVDLAELWDAHRRRVVDVAYRMLGSITDAEDVAQEVFVRLARTDVTRIDDVRGWVVTVTARICIDQLRSARVTRRQYVGPWLPEPVVALSDDGADPADRVTLDDSVRIALLAVLERLTPAQRTVFVLHDVFGLPFDDVAGIVGRSVGACRQLASRARRHVRADDPRYRVDAAEHRRVAERFARAATYGDLDGLIAVLDPDAVGEFDSGGLMRGVPTSLVVGAERVASVLLASVDGLGVRFTGATVNGEPGVVAALRDRVSAVLALEVRDGRVDHVRAVGNPRKLRHI